MQDYYSILADKFCEHRKYDFRRVNTHDDLCQAIAANWLI